MQKQDRLRRQALVISERFPAYRDNILAQADLALEGKLVLPGTAAKPYFVGNPPDWHVNPVNDAEYLWGLNRMSHWKPLLWAYAFTGEARYAQKVVEELDDWIARCPRPRLSQEYYNLVTPWRSLETGIRMFESWPCLSFFLEGTEFMPPERLVRFRQSLQEHGEVLAQICPQLWPKADHNHYLMENLGLLVLATVLPDSPTTSQWAAHACRELERCAAAQIMPEGGQIEGCPHYHNGCIYWFARAAIQAQSSRQSLSNDYRLRLERMVDYTIHATRPSGTTVPWGDSDAICSFAATSVVYGYLATGRKEPLATLKALLGVASLHDAVLNAAWLIDDLEPVLSLIDSLDSSATASFPTCNWQKSLDQAAFRTDWSREALSVFFACRTPVNNGHAHIDPAGFDFTGLGRPLVVDPGRFTYRNDDDRRKFKSAAWHNTLTLDDRDPFEYLDTWRYGPQKDGHIVNVVANPGILAASSEHHNYEPAIHRRAIAIIDGEFLVVLDDVIGANPDTTVQLHYHLDFTAVEVGGRQASAKGAEVSLVVVTSPGLEASTRPGKISDKSDVARPSTLLLFEDLRDHASRRRYATLLVPYQSSTGKPEVSWPEIEADDDDWGIRFTLRAKPRLIRWSELTS